MAQTFDLLLKGATVVNHDGAILRDVGVRDGKIAEIGDLAQAVAGEVVDCTGLHVLPGVIDSQVHFSRAGPNSQGRSRIWLTGGGAWRDHKCL